MTTVNTKLLPWTYDDGGRRAAGFRGDAGDCGVRAISIATGIDYREVYDELFDIQREMKARSPGLTYDPSPRTGVVRGAMDRYLLSRGWLWLPTMSIGSGCRTHLAQGEVPDHVVVRLSKHYAAVVDGVVRDTHDPTREGTRCVYGWWEPTDYTDG